jgi:hypothetical protein
LVFLGASQLFDGSWNVTMAVEVHATPTPCKLPDTSTLIITYTQPFCNLLIIYSRM